MRNVLEKAVQKIETHIVGRLCDNVENTVEPDRT
jgi:hypothetical protein